MNLGLDYHGVIDKDYWFFAKLTHKLEQTGHNVYVLTGQEESAELREKLKHISYTFLYSITTYHKEIHTPMIFKNGDKTQPLIDDVLWDRSKSDFCKEMGIDLHIDDSTIYNKYFVYDTQYLVYNEAVRCFLQTL